MAAEIGAQEAAHLEDSLSEERAARIRAVLLEEYENNAAFRALIDARVEQLEATAEATAGGTEDMARPEVYTVDEAAAVLKVAPKTIRAWLKNGKLRGVKVGPLWRIREEDIQAMLTVPIDKV